MVMPMSDDYYLMGVHLLEIRGIASFRAIAIFPAINHEQSIPAIAFPLHSDAKHASWQSSSVNRTSEKERERETRGNEETAITKSLIS